MYIAEETELSYNVDKFKKIEKIEKKSENE